jgi:replicative DNA helicase
LSNQVFDLEAETAMLSLMLTYPELALENTGVKIHMLDSQSHGLLFKTIQDIINDGLVPDSGLIISTLESNNKLAEVGGKTHISSLLGRGYSKSNFKEFCSQVINNYKVKTLLKVLSEVDRNSISTSEVDKVLDSLRTQFEKLSNDSTTDTTLDFESALKISWDKIKEKTENHTLPGVSTGLRDLDAATGGMIEGEEWIVGGRPSMGKTASLCNFALSIARNDIPSLIMSKEMNRQSVVERLLAIETEIPITDIRQGLLDQKQINVLTEKIRNVKDYPIYIDCNFTSDLNEMLSTIRKYKRTKNVRVVYLDYLQLMCGEDDDQNNELSKYSRAFKLLAEDLGLTVVLYSQLNRLVELRVDKRPVLSDLRQSGSLEQNADIVIMLYRPDYYDTKTNDRNTLELILRKSRNGPIGTIVSKFFPDTNKIVGV